MDLDARELFGKAVQEAAGFVFDEAGQGGVHLNRVVAIGLNLHSILRQRGSVYPAPCPHGGVDASMCRCVRPRRSIIQSVSS